MTGSLQRKRTGGNYYVVISTKDENGKRKLKWLPTGLKKKIEAKKVLDDILARIGNNSYINPSNILFSDFMKNWLENVIKKEVEITTYDGYCVNIKTHIIPYFRKTGIRLQELKKCHLKQYFECKYESGRIDNKGGLSAKSLRRQRSNINQALKYAINCGFIFSNPLEDIKLPRIKKYYASYYHPKQLSELMEYTKGTKIETAVILAVYYGLRRGEVLGLRWQDIDFKESMISIYNTRTGVNQHVEKKPKSDNSNRVLPLILSVGEYLKDLKNRQQKDKAFFGNTYMDNDYICRYEDGTPLNKTTLNHIFTKTILEKGMKRIRFHDLRHSAACYQLKAGTSLKEIQIWLGHSGIGITADLYLHIDQQMKINTANKIDGIFKTE